MSRSRIKTVSLAVRASAPLLTAGAYDASSLVVNCANGVQLEVYASYTRHASATIGQAKFKIMVSDVDTGDVTTFYPRTIKDTSTLTIAGGEAMSPVYTDATLMPVPAGAGIEGRTYIVDVGTARRVMVLFAEVGDTTNFGTVVCSAIVLAGAT